MNYLRKGGIIALLIFVCTLLWQCRDKAVTEKEIPKETIVESKIPGVIVDLCASADVAITDTTDIGSLLRFRMIDSAGAIQEINIDRAARLFKRLESGKKVMEIPLMEFLVTKETLMMFNGRGYGGQIRARLILDQKTLRIEKVEFEHQAESESYASVITTSSFEDQFSGLVIKDKEPHFGIVQSGKLLRAGSRTVDGVSGATQTSLAVIEMMNEGISRIKDYAVTESAK